LTRLPRKARAGRVDYGSLWKNYSGLAWMRSHGLKIKSILRS